MSVLATLSSVHSAEPNVWQRLEQATITGERWDIPVGYSSDMKKFLVLGGRTSWAKYKQPRPYDVLSLDPSAGNWGNEFPAGKDWGPPVGDATAPGWKDESFHLQDREGNVRPNWTVYGTFSLGQKYDYDPDTRAFYFFAGGRTFRYEPAMRVWTDLQPATNPEAALGGILLWSSLCYDRQHKQFVLFGGGNVQSERGDPGTWTYTPATNAWKQLELKVQPPQRANSRLVYDPVHQKIVLFGGDQLDQLIADTWTFDLASQTWTEARPRKSPSPRAGHALLWLPKSKKVLLLGGYTYTSAVGYVERLYQPMPLEAWVFDVATGEWQLIKRLDAKSSPESPAPTPLPAAVDEDDLVLALSKGTWLVPIDATKADPAGTDEFGAAPGATVRRSGPHDPAWFQQDVPPADPVQVAAELRALPVNRFVLRPTPKLPRPNMDWGSAVLAPELDLIVRFSGGHSAYSGTAPQVYNIKSDRYSVPFAAEYPLEYVYSNDQIRGEWSFQGNPWMTGHTYKSTGYDPHLKCLVFAPHDYTYFFDPLQGRWSRSPEKNPYRADFYNVTVCATPQGAVVWADRRQGGDGLWRLDAASRTWRELPIKGDKLPNKSPDQHGLAFDSKRNRLLFFSNSGTHKGDVLAYDLQSAEARWLESRGHSHASVPSRETVYLPDADLVLLAARTRIYDRSLWLAYDCAANAWKGLELPGDDPIGRGTSGGAFHNSVGMMYDPARKLVWFVGQNSHVTTLKLDRASAVTVPLD
jgi:hypothetical protein